MLVVLTIVFLLVLMNGLYVAAEFAIIGARPSRLQALADQGHPVAGRLLGTVRDANLLDTYISTAQVGISVASLGLAMYAEHELAIMFEDLLPHDLGILGSPHIVAGALSLALITYLHVVVGEMVPKSMALSAAESTAFRVAIPMMVSRILYWPIVTPLTWLGGVILRVLRVPSPSTHERILTPDELGHVISQSTEGGMLLEHEGRMLLNIIGFGEGAVADVMTPWQRVETLSASLTASSAGAAIARSEHHRFPVVDAEGEAVVGVLFLKDLVRQEAATSPETVISEMVRDPLRVVEDLPLEDLLALFRREHGRLAVVENAEGRARGVVTLEDLTAQVVGSRRPSSAATL